jgi:DNA-binding LytR/AlgR family response regulator
MIRCVIIEDQAPAQRILQNYIGKTDFIKLQGTFFNGTDCLEFLKGKKIDLIFLDINLPKLSGIDLISKFNIKSHIIITTASQKYAVKGYELDVVDYLLKPFSFERYLKAIKKVKKLKEFCDLSEISKLNTQETVTIKQGYEHIILQTKEIRFINSDEDYTIIQCKNKKYITNNTLRCWSEKLSAHQFVRVHRSYIVNLQYVFKVKTSSLFVEEHEIPIGRTYKKEFQRKYMNTE